MITVFIKHEQVEFGNNLEFHKRNKHLGQESRNARLAEETSKVSRNVCWTLQRRRRSRHSTHRRLKLGLVLTLSNTASREYQDTRKMLNELVHLTADCAKKSLAVDIAEDVALVSAIAQRVIRAVKIDAVIA